MWLLRNFPADTSACVCALPITILGSRLVSHIFCPYRFRRSSLIRVSASSRACLRTSPRASRTAARAASCSASMIRS